MDDAQEHTSLPGRMHPACLLIDELVAQCNFDRTKRSGPGGQHRNKVETAVVVTHLPTGIRAEAGERRSQSQNRTQAIQRLRLKLAVEVRHPLRSTVSSIWKGRIRGSRLEISPSHPDFPAILAEALDAIYHHQFVLREAAEFLFISTSQLVKVLKKHGESLARVNAERQSRGETPLR